jgi:heme oxygenase (mycobilin-producing)
MHFTDAGVEEFLTIFNTYKNDIRNSEGCTHLELLKDVHESNTYTTLSY